MDRDELLRTMTAAHRAPAQEHLAHLAGLVEGSPPVDQPTRDT